MNRPRAAMLDGQRLHLNHGPIDLIVQAFGPRSEQTAAYDQVTAAFQTVLSDLAAQLPLLRQPVVPGDPVPDATAIAMRMRRAVIPHAATFVTPMAAVAGAVADAMLAALIRGRRLDRAYVNNGGDIAVYLCPGQALTAAAGPGLGSRVSLSHGMPGRGLATSGWRGRSFSLGIADAVTVVARDAAEADVAATLIANAVDLPGHPAIQRTAACALSPDSDLGDRAVTTAVGRLRPAEYAQALSGGHRLAQDMLDRGLILGAALWCGPDAATCGTPQLMKEPLSA